MFVRDEHNHWIGNCPKLVFYASNISTIVAYATTTVAWGGGMKVNIESTGGSTVTIVVPFMVVASS